MTTRTVRDYEVTAARWYFIEQGMESDLVARIPFGFFVYHLAHGKRPSELWAMANAQPIALERAAC